MMRRLDGADGCCGAVEVVGAEDDDVASSGGSDAATFWDSEGSVGGDCRSCFNTFGGGGGGGSSLIF